MKFLLSSASGIGDFVFLLPVTFALKEKYPNAQIDVLVRGTEVNLKIYKDILKYVTKNTISNIFYYNSNEILHDIKMLISLKSEKYDYGLVLRYKNQPFSMWPYRILNFVAKDTVALKGYLPNHLDITNFVDTDNSQLHNVEAYFKILNFFEIESSLANKYYFSIFDSDKLEKRYNKLELKATHKIVVLCVGSNNVKRKLKSKYIENDVKNWPIDRWFSLANMLSENGYNIILVGGKQEAKKSKDIDIKLNGKVINLIGKINISDTLAVLNQADLIVGADTGIMHCASALSKKTLMLLGAVSPKQAEGYGDSGFSIYLNKPCAPCYGTNRDLLCVKPICMLDISTKMVFEKICSLIKTDVRI